MKNSSAKENIKYSKTRSTMTVADVQFIGKKRVENPEIIYAHYDSASYSEEIIPEIKDFDTNKILIKEDENDKTVNWFNITGLHDTGLLERFGEKFNIHPLIIEDIANTEHHPKMDVYDDYIFMEMKLIKFDRKSLSIDSEQIAFVLGDKWILTFLESNSELFQPIRQRLQNGAPRMFREGTAFLHYWLIDFIVDKYYNLIEEIEDVIDSHEEVLVSRPNPNHLKKIHRLRRILIFLRKSISPLREIIRKLEMIDESYLGQENRAYIKDLYDHIVYVVETLDTMRDTVAVFSDIYLSSINNRLNEVMKVLTVISTIFIPLTFIAGVYGMNFKFMPELEWEWGYPILWLIMTLIVVSMITFFKKKKWF